MKKLYSTMMMLATMIAALGMVSCDSDDDHGGNGKNLIIDGESYYTTIESTVVQNTTVYGGMYLTVQASKHKEGSLDSELTMWISPSKVSELSVGQTFDSSDIDIHDFHYGFSYNEIRWDAISGNILIKDIKDTQLTIQINNLVIESWNDAQHSFNGTVTLYNSLSDENGNYLPFSGA